MATIVTHDGSFHADEALACFMLGRTAAFRDASITRTRNPDVINAGSIVVDVGGEYDAARNRFDHHQRGFAETFSPDYKTKLSSAGLIYKHFGREAVASVLEWPVTDERIERVYQKVYRDFIESMDGVDNGVNAVEGGKQNYESRTSLSHRVGRLNPYWNETVDIMERFQRAVAITGEEFVSIVRSVGLSWLPARAIVERAMDERDDTPPSSGRIIVLPQYCPWTEHLFELEAERNLPEDRRIVYVLYEDQSKSWRVQAVPVKAGAFENRKALPEPWRGLRDDELAKCSGIEGTVFTHAAGFIGGNKTREGAMLMAQKALLF